MHTLSYKLYIYLTLCVFVIVRNAIVNNKTMHFKNPLKKELYTEHIF